MKYFVWPFFIIQFIAPCLSQNETVVIYWDENEKLTWADFQGKPDTLNIYYKDKEAASTIEIKADSYWEDGLPNFKVQALFYKKDSWTRNRQDSLLLKHEQLHFDIAELYSRKIKNAVYDLRSVKVDNMGSYLNSIKELISQRKEEDVRYDKDTFHGMLVDKQLEWGRRIARELKLWDDFKD